MNDGLIEVRVTVNMAGATLGQTRWVDPENPEIAERLRLGYLQRLAVEPTEAEIEPSIVEADESEAGVAGDEVDAAEIVE